MFQGAALKIGFIEPQMSGGQQSEGREGGKGHVNTLSDHKELVEALGKTVDEKNTIQVRQFNDGIERLLAAAQAQSTALVTELKLASESAAKRIEDQHAKLIEGNYVSIPWAIGAFFLGFAGAALLSRFAGFMNRPQQGQGTEMTVSQAGREGGRARA